MSNPMEPVCLMYVSVSLVAGLGLGLFTQWGFHRRLLKLELQQADLEGELLSEKRKRAINTRWQGTQNDEALLRQLITQGGRSASSKRYANDPIGEDDGVSG